MKTKIIEIDGTKIMVGLDTDGSIHAQQYTAPATPPAGTLPEGIRDKIGLSAWIQSQGHARGSEEYNRLYAEHAEALPLEFNEVKSIR